MSLDDPWWQRWRWGADFQRADDSGLAAGAEDVLLEIRRMADLIRCLGGTVCPLDQFLVRLPGLLAHERHQLPIEDHAHRVHQFTDETAEAAGEVLLQLEAFRPGEAGVGDVREEVTIWATATDRPGHTGTLSQAYTTV